MVSGYLGVVKVCTLLSDSRLIRVSQDGDLGYLFFRVGGKCTIQFLCYDTQQDTYFVLSLFFVRRPDFNPQSRMFLKRARYVRR